MKYVLQIYCNKIRLQSSKSRGIEQKKRIALNFYHTRQTSIVQIHTVEYEMKCSLFVGPFLSVVFASSWRSQTTMSWYIMKINSRSVQVTMLIPIETWNLHSTSNSSNGIQFRYQVDYNFSLFLTCHLPYLTTYANLDNRFKGVIPFLLWLMS